MKFRAIKDKTTPGAVRFKEVDNEGNFVADHARSIYLTKEQWAELDSPEAVTVTIEAEA